ncbi:hypothetical protein M2408_003931 [Sphingobacterium sp. BIGb0165]|nr:hypothetical protein [Sphingobacterium sp. BIGb0165]
MLLSKRKEKINKSGVSYLLHTKRAENDRLLLFFILSTPVLILQMEVSLP